MTVSKKLHTKPEIKQSRLVASRASSSVRSCWHGASMTLVGAWREEVVVERSSVAVIVVELEVRVKKYQYTGIRYLTIWIRISYIWCGLLQPSRANSDISLDK